MVPPEREPEQGYIRIFPRNKNRNEGTFACAPGTKTGTRLRSPKPPFYETALLSPSEDGLKIHRRRFGSFFGSFFAFFVPCFVSNATVWGGAISFCRRADLTFLCPCISVFTFHHGRCRRRTVTTIFSEKILRPSELLSNFWLSIVRAHGFQA